MKNKLVAIVFLILISTLAATQIEVGFYDNPPKLYRDEQGNAAGFWAEITTEIAQQNNYEIIWVFGSWQECLQRLQTGAIDLLPDVSYTQKRAEKFIFAEQTALLSWSRLYIHPDTNFQTILDLQNKKIAALGGSVNLEGNEGLRDLLQQFKIEAEIREFPDYQAVFQAIEDKTVFAGVANKDFVSRLENKFKLKATPLIFQPADLRFAFASNSAYQPQIIKQFDDSLIQLKNDSSSIYHESMQKHLGKSSRQKFTPPWLKFSLLWLFIILLISFLAIAHLNRKLAHKIKETANLNQEWETTFNTINDYIWILDKNQKIIKINHPHQPTLGLPLDNILGQYCHNIVHQQDYPIEACPLKRSAQSLKRESMELRYGSKWFKVIVDPLLDAENKFMGAVHIIQDITQSKEFIEELQATNQQLAASDQELRALNQQLEASEQQLRAANQQLAAHEKQLMETNLRLCQEIKGKAETQKQLAQQLATKKTLLEELFHRTKNNMQIISSMLNAELRRTDNRQQAKTLTNIKNKIYAL
ncbi:MAG: transporter substrate-binding domain-containing protein, partial [Candidatus Cloacimonadales bacterium]